VNKYHIIEYDNKGCIHDFIIECDYIEYVDGYQKDLKVGDYILTFKNKVVYRPIYD
jgi:hypothetical protein